MEQSKDNKLYDADLFDLIHQGNRGDLDFYLRACGGATNVLELGCGSGRIAIALIQEGALVTGLDNHPGMLARAKSNALNLGDGVPDRLTLVEGSMAAFSINQKFERIIIPYNGLFCLADDKEMLNCFESVRRHLADEGLFIFDVYDVSEELHQELVELTDENGPYAEDEPEPIVSLVDGASRIDVFESYEWHPQKQQAFASYRYVRTTGRSVQEETHTIRHHYLTEKQLIALLSKAGLEVLDVRIGFETDSYEDTEQLIVVAKAAS